METIKNYLDNMFSGLPKTEEMTKLKEDIYGNMQDKYQELKAEGKTENEVIGVVISEFGNIEEILEEFDIKHSENEKVDVEQKEDFPEVTIDMARDYIKIKKTEGKFVGIGVTLCIIGVAIMIACQALIKFRTVTDNENVGQALGLAIMFVFVAGGVALFIYNGFLVSPYAYMKGRLNTSTYVKQQLSAEWVTQRPTNMVKLVVGICMCVISPVPLFLGVFASRGREEMVLIGTVILLLIVAFAVYFIISAGNVMEAYERLLEIGSYTRDKKKGNKTIELVASIVWPLITAAYLFMGFLFNLWHPGWVIFPLTGILFGVFSAVVERVSDK